MIKQKKTELSYAFHKLGITGNSDSEDHIIKTELKIIKNYFLRTDTERQRKMCTVHFLLSPLDLDSWVIQYHLPLLNFHLSNR